LKTKRDYSPLQKQSHLSISHNVENTIVIASLRCLFAFKTENPPYSTEFGNYLRPEKLNKLNSGQTVAQMRCDDWRAPQRSKYWCVNRCKKPSSLRWGP